MADPSTNGTLLWKPHFPLLGPALVPLLLQCCPAADDAAGGLINSCPLFVVCHTFVLGFQLHLFSLQVGGSIALLAAVGVALYTA